jgi:hypothetical protein
VLDGVQLIGNRQPHLADLTRAALAIIGIDAASVAAASNTCCRWSGEILAPDRARPEPRVALAAIRSTSRRTRRSGRPWN